MIINHNRNSLNTLNKYNKANKKKSKAMEKLSSGLRINSASDDAAGLAISQKMRAQIRCLEQAERNIQDGISLLQTAEGGLSEIENPCLQRIRELCVQAANDTLTKSDRLSIAKEINEIKKEINNIANNTEFNGIKLINENLKKMEKVNHEIEINKNINPKKTEGINKSKPIKEAHRIEWATKVTDSSVSFHSIAYNGDKFVAVVSEKVSGIKRAGKIFISDDGENWKDVTTTKVNEIDLTSSDITSNGKEFIIARSKTLLKSTDGINWTQQTINRSPINIKWCGNKYFALTHGAEVSDDGENWTTKKM